jgi:hypothetical protein
VGGRRVQHHGHEGPDVVKSGSLSVESTDVVDVEASGGDGRRNRRGVLMSDRRAAEEEALRGGHLGGQSSAQGTFVLQGEGRDTLTLPRGSHSSLDRSEGGDECGVVLGGCRYGGKPRRRATAQGNGSGITEGPEAVDVRGTATSVLAAGGSEAGQGRSDGRGRGEAGVQGGGRAQGGGSCGQARSRRGGGPARGSCVQTCTRRSSGGRVRAGSDRGGVGEGKASGGHGSSSTVGGAERPAEQGARALRAGRGSPDGEGARRPGGAPGQGATDVGRPSCRERERGEGRGRRLRWGEDRT